MGKARGKTPRPANNGSPIEVAEPLPLAGPGNVLKATDGHNVDGWTEKDIRTYNELLNERAKLEKEKTELEHKSSRHQTHRALLDENSVTMDNLFKAQLGGGFKFIASVSCCLDTDLGIAGVEGARGSGSPCKHEICTRAKTTGVSWTEMDSIKYYHTRIITEKSQRMQNALRKQRDVELARIKKENDEELALRARKTTILERATRGSAEGQQNDKGDKAGAWDPSALDLIQDPKYSLSEATATMDAAALRRVGEELRRLPQDVKAHRVSRVNALAKMDLVRNDFAGQAVQLNELQKRMQRHTPIPGSLADVLQNTLASSNPDAFTQALSVMTEFFSSSDPNDVQAAIKDLRRVIEINGPLSSVLQRSFQALEEMMAQGNTKDLLAVPSGKGTGPKKPAFFTNVVEVLLDLRAKTQGADAASLVDDPNLRVDEYTLRANLGCLRVEEAAKRDMLKTMARMASDTVENVTTALRNIQKKAVEDAPVPTLTKIVLDDVISEILFNRSVRGVLNEAASGANVNQLSGKITSLVIAAARNKPESYLAILELVKESIKRSQKNSYPPTLLAAVAKVQDSMSKFVAAQEAKQRKAPVATTNLSSGPGSFQTVFSTQHLLAGTSPDEESWMVFKKFFDTPAAQQPSTLRATILAHYHKHLDEGVWEIFKSFAAHHKLQTFRFEPWDVEKEFFRANMRLAAALRQEKLLDTIISFQELGACPGMTAIVVVQHLTYQIREDLETAKSNTMTLRNILTHHDPVKNREWFHSFSFIAQAMTDLFAIIMFQMSALDPVDAPIMAIDVVGIVCTFVLGISISTQAESNLHAIAAFITCALVDYSKGHEIGKLQDALARFLHMCQDSRYRCSPQHTCKLRIIQLNTERLKQLIPAPLNLNRKGVQSSTAVAQDTFKGAPLAANVPKIVPGRQRKLQMLVDSDWEVAGSLVPHLRCLEAATTCVCVQDDQDFARDLSALKLSLENDLKELNSYLNCAAEAPQALWERLEANEQALHDRPLRFGRRSRRVVNTAAELLPAVAEQTADPKSGKTPHVELGQVQVSTPSIQNGTSSNISETGNVERDLPEESDGNRTSTTSAATTMRANQSQSVADPRSKQQPAPDQTMATVAPQLGKREVEIKTRLTTFVDGVLRLDTLTTKPILGHKDLLSGVTKQLQAMAFGHIRLSWIVARGQSYLGLQSWLERHYSRDTVHTVVPHDVPVGVTPVPTKVQSPSRGQPTQTSSSAISAASLERKAQHATADVDQLARKFLRLVEIVTLPCNRVSEGRA